MSSFFDRSRHNDGSGAEPLRHTYDPDTETHRYHYTPTATNAVSRPNPRSSTVHRLTRVFEILFSFAIVWICAHIIAIYRISRYATVRYPQGNTLSAWPLDGPNLAPTYILIIAALWTVFYNVLTLIAGCGKLGDARNGFFGRLTRTVLAIFTVLLWTAVLVFAKLGPRYQYAATDLYNWSCEHASLEIVTNRQLIGLGEICTETTTAFYLGILIGALEILNYIGPLIGLWVSSQTQARQRRQQQRTVSTGLIPFQINAYRKIEEPGLGDTPEMFSRGVMS